MKPPARVSQGPSLVRRAKISQVEDATAGRVGMMRTRLRRSPVARRSSASPGTCTSAWKRRATRTGIGMPTIVGKS
jgi:hypothetical protein